MGKFDFSGLPSLSSVAPLSSSSKGNAISVTKDGRQVVAHISIDILLLSEHFKLLHRSQDDCYVVMDEPGSILCWYADIKSSTLLTVEDTKTPRMKRKHVFVVGIDDEEVVSSISKNLAKENVFVVNKVY